MDELNVCSIEVKKSGSGAGDDEVEAREVDGRRPRRRLAMGRGAKDNADGLSSREVTIVARMVVLGAAVAGDSTIDDDTTTPQ